MKDQDKLVKALLTVAALYGAELSELAIPLWVVALADYEVGQIERAIAAHVRDPKAGRFFPKPADLIGRMESDADDRALIAWGDVLSGARRGGGGQLDPNARAALDSLGGWSVICRADESENGFLQRRFVDAYRAYRKRDEAEFTAVGNSEIRRIK